MLMESLIQAITGAVINQAVNSASKKFDADLKKSWVANSRAVKKYIRSSKKKYEKTKTILYKETPISLISIYVGTRFNDPNGGGESDQDEVVNLLEAGEKVVVSATAGAGKSVFAKFAFLSLLSLGKRVPLMVELRHLNDSGLGILELIGQDLRAHGVKATNDTIRHWVGEGRFAIILDGYDELSQKAAKRVNSELIEFDKNLSDSALLVTTRPCDEVEFFGDWSLYRVKKLSRVEALQLIGKLSYDEDTKELFMKELRSTLYQKHRDFLSNPLLLTIMLMTYGEIAEIPSKMHVFYEHAFDVLFYRHDASKGMYSRKLFSGLAIDDFKDVLSSVSMSGYVRSQISFSNTELLGYIRKAKKLFGIKKLSPEHYKTDLLRSVCILVADGKDFTFNHRSFQEYFSAVFLVNFPSPDKMTLYDLCLDRGPFDNTLGLAFEMNQALLEKELIKPYVERSLEMIKDDPVTALRVWVGTFEIRWIGDPTNGKPVYRMQNPTRELEFMNFAERSYWRIAGSKMPKFGRTLTKKSFIEHVGPIKEPLIVPLHNISAAHKQLLADVGLISHARKRLDFLNWLAEYLENKSKRLMKTDIETWL